MKSPSLNRVVLASIITSISILQTSALPGAFRALLDRAELVFPRQCSWAGHCAGAACGTDDDCSDVLTCINRVCGGVSPTRSPGGNKTSQIIAAPPASTAVSCSWAGHCRGAKCGSDDDCSDVLTCISNVCGGPGGGVVATAPPPSPTKQAPKCEWEGHCAGSKCGSDNDCSDVLTCQKGVCAK